MDEKIFDKERIRKEKELLYEHRLPDYLQKDLVAYKEGLENGSDMLDCLWGELYQDINIAQINERSITADCADYLRNKYLWGRDEDYVDDDTV